ACCTMPSPSPTVTSPMTSAAPVRIHAVRLILRHSTSWQSQDIDSGMKTVTLFFIFIKPIMIINVLLRFEIVRKIEFIKPRYPETRALSRQFISADGTRCEQRSVISGIPGRYAAHPSLRGLGQKDGSWGYAHRQP
ncbi:hypothetical protein, partial [Thermoflexus sp.]|uniref:hypothetical protein n=1 Tax=Thermoflexus sp. TaxID=1969742 RepID=UPI002ADD8CA1